MRMKDVCMHLAVGWELDLCVLSKTDQKKPLRRFCFKNLSSSSSFSSSSIAKRITNTLYTEIQDRPL